jgi:uncharacterized protein (DUF1786 family)
MSTSNPNGKFRPDPLRILAIDVGAGTQDILLFESDKTIENCVKLVLPSQTQVIAQRIRAATGRRQPVFLRGVTMGGGATSAAVEEHIGAGLPVYASSAAARTLHNDLERVRDKGVQILERAPADAHAIECGDVDLGALQRALGEYGITIPELVAVAVQDHGFQPDAGGREFRYEFLQSLLAGGGNLVDKIYRQPPVYMTRMLAVRGSLPGRDVLLMDTGAAAVLGVLGDAHVAAAAARDGAVLINIGNMHTFGVAMRGERVLGLFEHHTGGITPDVLADLTARLQTGALTHEHVIARGGHGAAFAPGYEVAGPYNFVAVTGPNRRIAAALGYHQAAPHGDMMLAGPFGLVEGVLRLLASEGMSLPLTSLMATTH